MFEFSHLRAFVAVAEELHFGRAAARLNMTQPPLSRQVQALEYMLGVPLFVRTSRSVRLTSAGHRLLGEAQRLLDQAEASFQVARMGAHTETGQVTLGLIGASTYDVLPKLVRRVRTLLPDIELSLREMLTSEQVEALALRRIDIGIGRLPRGARGLQTAVIARERLVLAVPDGHPLTTKPGLILRDLADYPFIGFDPGPNSSIYELQNQIFIAEQFTPRIVQRSRQTQTILALVSAGAGLALVAEKTSRASFANVRFLDIAIAPYPLLDMHSLWRPDNDNPVMPAFLDLVLKTFTRGAALDPSPGLRLAATPLMRAAHEFDDNSDLDTSQLPP